MLGIAPIVYPSIRRGGPGGADLMVIDQSRAMSATLPSKRTGDAFKAVVMRTDCPLSSDIASTGSCGASLGSRVSPAECGDRAHEVAELPVLLHRAADESTSRDARQDVPARGVTIQRADNDLNRASPSRIVRTAFTLSDHRAFKLRLRVDGPDNGSSVTLL